MSCVVSIHASGGKLAGSGVIVADNLVLTCAHVVNLALQRAENDERRPSAQDIVKVQFAGAPGEGSGARIDEASDAWSAPPADRSAGADICLLKLTRPLPLGAAVGRVSVVQFKSEFNVRVSGYPADWNERAARPNLDIGTTAVLGTDGYLWLLRANAGTWAAALVSGRRAAGQVYSGYSGGPLQVGEAVVGIAAQARKDVLEATAYATPAYHFPPRIVTPSPRQVWLAAHGEAVAKRFMNQMAASKIRSGLAPQDLYLDLLVTERRPQSADKQDRGSAPASIDEVLRRADAPLLLMGEGGAGKSTALLYVAARAAERLSNNLTMPVPVYVDLAHLTRMEDLPDLLALIAGSLVGVANWQEFVDLEVVDHHRILFLFDSFNEVPEHLQRNCALVLQRFIEKHGGRHTYLIATRAVAPIDQLSRPSSAFRIFDILRLTPDRVEGFLQKLGLGALYDRMPLDLRELAGNPFMLLAVARTLASATSEDTLPRKQGRLYQQFVAGWMRTEADKRAPAYSYELVKEHYLAFLAKRMTSAGATSLARESALDEESSRQLEGIAARLLRRKALPASWTIDGCLEEILYDGLFKQANGQLFFIHQSVQEYYTALCFIGEPDVLVKFVPRLFPEFASTYHLTDVPNHRFVSPLLMMVGLIEDATKVVEALAARNLILAARAISSANYVHPQLIRSLQQAWLELLDHPDLRQRAIGCSALALDSLKDDRIVARLLRMAVTADYRNAALATQALKQLGTANVVAVQLVELVLSLSDGELEERKGKIREVLRDCETRAIVETIFKRWRKADSDELTRSRLESLLATLHRESFMEEIHRARVTSSDPAVAAAADELALSVENSWAFGMPHASRVRRAIEQLRKTHFEQVAQFRARLESADESVISSSLRSVEPAERTAAAQAAAERRLPLGEQILESLLLSGSSLSEAEVVAALISLLSEQVAVSKLMGAAEKKRRPVARFPPEIDSPVVGEPLSEALDEWLKQSGIKDALKATDSQTDGEKVTWNLQASSWDAYRPLYQVEESARGLRLYDLNGPPRAFAILAQLPGDVSLIELRRAVEHEDPRIQEVAIRALTNRRDPHLVEQLFRIVRSSASDGPVAIALSALRELGAPQSASLIDKLLVDPQHAQSIHHVLVPLEIDSAIQTILDQALSSADETRRTAAADELGRWFLEANLDLDRASRWRNEARLQRLLQLVLSDRFSAVRRAAADTLCHAKSEFVLASLTEALFDNSAETRVHAAEALIVLEVQSAYRRIGEVMLQIAKENPSQDLRLRAGNVLGQVPGGRDKLYSPVKDALNKAEWRRALQLSDAALEIAPDDVDLLWWRGHALKGLGDLDRAVECHARAAELMKHAPLIFQTLAQTLLQLGDPQRAREAAQKAVDINIHDADSQAMLAWCSYKTGDINAAAAATKMAVDLDPVHADAIWVAVLVHLRQSDCLEARSSFDHALTVRRLLSPGLNLSFAKSFLEALDQIDSRSPKLLQLLEDIAQSLSLPNTSSTGVRGGIG